MIRVLIVEDSVVFQKVLVSFLRDEGNIEIVGIVDNGEDAVERCRTLKPDLVTMDIFMPKMNGLEATRRIMEECPTRIVIISSMVNATNLKYSFEAIQAGAIEVIEKPSDTMRGNYETVRKALVGVLNKTMEADPVKRFSWLIENPWEESAPVFRPSLRQTTFLSASSNGLSEEGDDAAEQPVSILPEFVPSAIPGDFNPWIIAIGGSTGAPAVLSDILRSLPSDYRIPIVVAQHIVKGFVAGMAEWLDSLSALSVRVAEEDERPTGGTVLFAPDNMHIGVSETRRITLTPGGRDDLYIPSVNILFHSMARVYKSRALGIVLSGMGKDGSIGLLEMRRAGAATVAQNEESSVVYGMPKVAASMGAVMEELTPSDIASLLLSFHERAKTHVIP